MSRTPTLPSVPRSADRDTTVFLQAIKIAVEQLTAQGGNNNAKQEISSSSFQKLNNSINGQMIEDFGGNIGELQEMVTVESLLGILNNSISNSQLDKDLLTTIGGITTNATAISKEIQDRIAALLAANTAINGNQAAIASETQTRIDELSALGSRIDIIVAKTDNNTASIVAEKIARTTQDTAHTSKLEALDVITTDASARIGELQTATVNNEQSIAETKTELRAEFDSTLNVGPNSVTGRIDKNTAAIQQESITRADQVGAYAGTVNRLQTTVNGNTSSIQQQAWSINGLNAQYTIKVDVNGRVSGFGLASSSSSSAFAIRADRFYIAPPSGYSSGEAAFIYQSTPFTDPETGTVIPAGLYLKTAFISNASIDTLKIRGQAVTVTSSASGISASGRTSNVYINSGGGSVLVRVVFYGLMGSGSQIINLYKNGALLSGPYGKAGNSGVDSFSEIFEVITSGSYGTDSFYATWTGADYVRSAVITATSLKR